MSQFTRGSKSQISHITTLQPVAPNGVAGDPSFRLRVVLALVTVLAVASVLANVALGAAMMDFMHMRAERDRAVAGAAEAVTKQESAQAMATESAAWADQLNQQVKSMEATENDLKRTEAKLRRDLSDARSDPASLPILQNAGIWKRLKTVKVLTQISPAAVQAGIRDGIVSDEAKATARTKLLPVDDSAADTLLLRISMIELSPDEAVWVVQLSLVQRWRVPGTDASHAVHVFEDGQLVLTRNESVAPKVLKTVSELIGSFGEMVAAAKK